MGDETNLDLRLEVIRTEMRAGFAEIKATLAAQNATAEKDSDRIIEIEKRLQQVELEAARNSARMKIVGVILSVSSGSVGALLSGIFNG